VKAKPDDRVEHRRCLPSASSIYYSPTDTGEHRRRCQAPAVTDGIFYTSAAQVSRLRQTVTGETPDVPGWRFIKLCRENRQVSKRALAVKMYVLFKVRSVWFTAPRRLTLSCTSSSYYYTAWWS